MSILPQTSLLQSTLNTWYLRNDTSLDFSTRLARQSTFEEHEGKIDDRDSTYARSTGVRSSIAVGVLTEYDDEMSSVSTTATDAIPTLTRVNSIASSAGSADTGAASGLDGGYVLETHEGVLTLPDRHQPNADLLCPFQILDCDKVFSDVVSFKTHVFSHFQQHRAPKIATCFLCDETFNQTGEDHPALAWNKMLSHLVNAHYRQGQRLALLRTDFFLMRWMFSRKIIDEAQLKRAQMSPLPMLLPNSSRLGPSAIVNTPIAPMPPPSTPPRSVRTLNVGSIGAQTEAYTVRAGRRAERRRHDATRPVYGRGNL